MRVGRLGAHRHAGGRCAGGGGHGHGGDGAGKAAVVAAHRAQGLDFEVPGHVAAAGRGDGVAGHAFAHAGDLRIGARFAGADTLATSYALSQAIKQIGKVDLIFGGRQAIDGDTAQVGPQVAEKLEIAQITYAEELLSVDDKSITIRRRLERGTEVVKAPMPVLVTVTSAGDDCRFPNAHRLLRQAKDEVRMINADSIDADLDRLGLKGSPTKVKRIENVVLAHKESLVMQPTEESLNELSATLIREHIL